MHIDLPPVLYPMLLTPHHVVKPWGGRRLEGRFGRVLPVAGPVGESWELYDRPMGSSVVRNGPLAGRTLAELRGGREIPLLLKVLDVHGRLSVQVHPTGQEAPGGPDDAEPKSEAWIVIEAGAGARIWRGFRDGVGPADLLRALEEDRPDDVLRSFVPREGDVVLVPAGMVHCLAGDLLLLEVQQSSETTYRLHDWGYREPDGSARPLQREEGLRSALFAAPGPDRVEPGTVEDDGVLLRAPLLRTRWFAADRWKAGGAATLPTPDGEAGVWQALFILSGQGTVRAFDRRAPEAPVGRGDTLLLPAGHEHYEVLPSPGSVLEGISFHVPPAGRA